MTAMMLAPVLPRVPAISESGGQYYANVYLSARNLYRKHDTNSFGFRYSALSQSQVYSLYATSRYRFDNGVSITPKLRFDNRQNDNGASQQSISPTFKVQYQSRKHYLYGDFGRIFYNTKSGFNPNHKTSIYFLYLGYRYYFSILLTNLLANIYLKALKYRLLTVLKQKRPHLDCFSV